MQARFLCVVLTHNHLPPPRKKLRIERCPLLPFTAHVLTDRPPPTAPGSNFGAMLQNYFQSGWAFLIPYLAAYLLYAWLKWPVNPVAAGSSPVDGGQLAVSAIGALSSTVSPFTAHSLLSTGVPCLLHFYWFLHALHLVLGALALRAWWRESGATVTGATDDSESVSNRAAQPLLSTVPQSGHRLPLPGDWPGQTPGWQQPATAINRPPSAMDRLWAAMPWLLLALLFYIPGVYLEWPSDPWEHLRRINEWRVLDTVTAHSSWIKSSYFIPYSLLSWCVGLRQIFWLDFYYTGICLLLCWQYYRLARACDLSERASMVFVLLQALLFGNNIFSFYRYYGISSSIYAQLGAVALTRIVLEAAKSPKLSLRSFFSLPCFISQLTAQRLPPALCSSAPSEVGSDLPSSVHLCRATGPDKYRVGSSQQRCPTVYRLLLSVLCILPLIRYNHVQGLGIAGLGVGAIIVWRLIEWRRSALWWLIAATLVTNVLFLWLYPRPAMVEIHRAQGFLNAWYGFNILNLASSAGDRMLQIISVFGLINLAAALVLIRRNHVIAWLTILPLAAMLLPCIAVPLEQVLAQASGPDLVITFQRFFFSIPPCLAVVCLWVQLHQGRRGVIPARLHRPHPSAAPLGPLLSIPADGSPPSRDGFYALVIVSMAFAALTTAPSSFPFYNRTWNMLSILPADLHLSHTIDQITATNRANENGGQPTLLTTRAASCVIYATGLRGLDKLVNSPSRDPSLAQTQAGALIPIVSVMGSLGAAGEFFIPPISELYSPESQSGYLSQHWATQHVAIDRSGTREYTNAAQKSGWGKDKIKENLFHIRRIP